MITADQRALVFEPLGAGAWRLCDTAVDEDDARRLVAYVERTHSGTYEAIWMGTGIGPSQHASRQDVLEAALVLTDAPAVSPRSKPIPIPHWAPLSPAHRVT